MAEKVDVYPLLLLQGYFLTPPDVHLADLCEGHHLSCVTVHSAQEYRSALHAGLGLGAANIVFARVDQNHLIRIHAEFLVNRPPFA